MKYLVIAILAIPLLVAVGCGPSQYTRVHGREYAESDTLPAPAVSLQDVIDMSTAGVGDSLIIAQINATDSRYDLSTADILKLKKSGVSERVIAAMIATDTTSREEHPRTRSYWYSDWYYPYYWSPWGGPFYTSFWYGFGWPYRYNHYYPYYGHGVYSHHYYYGRGGVSGGSRGFSGSGRSGMPGGGRGSAGGGRSGAGRR